MDVVIGSAEVSATGGHQALQDGEALTVARVSECGAYFPTANSLPIRPTHHYQRSNPIGSIVRIQQDQGSDRDDASEKINPVFSQHDREVPTKFHIGCSMKHSEIIEE